MVTLVYTDSVWSEALARNGLWVATIIIIIMEYTQNGVPAQYPGSDIIVIALPFNVYYS